MDITTLFYSINTQTAVRDSRGGGGVWGGYHSLLACHEVSHVTFYIRVCVCCQKVVVVNGKNQ